MADKPETETIELYPIRDRWTGDVLFTAEIAVTPDMTPSVKLGLAVKWGAKERKSLYGASLYGADLSRANISSADLSSANLSSADLSRANLSRANLSRANIYRADLSRANLSKVYYKPGEIVRPDSYDDNPLVECTHGIHFFATRAEAEERL